MYEQRPLDRAKGLVVTYAAFSVYLVGVLFLAVGVYRLWSGLVPPKYLNWLLLPGTLVAEMAYIFGCLITGGEVRRAKLMDGGGKGGAKGKSGGGEAEPATDASARLGFFGPLLAAILVVAACGAGVLVIDHLLGEPVMGAFSAEPTLLDPKLPTSMADFWGQLRRQVNLAEQMLNSWLELDWLDWHVPAFLYLAACLSIRVAPVRRPMRPTLLAVILAGAVIAVLAAAWPRFNRTLDGLWPLLTYIWTLLLMLLLASLLVRGIVGLVRAFAGKEKAAKSSSQ